MQAQNASTADPGLTLDTLRKMAAELKTIGAPNKAPLLVEMMYPLKPARYHKKRRVRKKWLARFGFVPDTSADKGQVWMIEPSPVTRCGIVLAYPKTYEKLKYESGGTNEHSNTDLRRIAGENQGRVRGYEPF